MHRMESETARVISLISNPNGISRIELARATGRSAAKMGKLVHRLVAAGILTEEESVETARGRRPTLLRPSANLGYILGIDIGMVHLRVVITDLQGKVIAAKETLSQVKNEVKIAIAKILHTADAVLAESEVKRENLLAVGISHSGGIDPEKGVCLYWHEVSQWKGTPLKQIFSDYYCVPCLVDDSVHCMALAEWVFGAARETDTFSLINLGQGIGSGLFIEGRLFRGAVGIAGELGHTTILPGGPQCSCGNHGCLEILASGQSMMDAAIHSIKENVTTSLRELTNSNPSAITVETIVQAAKSGDRLARRIVNQAGEYVGIALANLINLLNPPLVVFSGGTMIAAKELLLDVIIREASASAFEVAYAKTRIVMSPLDNLSAARGAALMMMQPVMDELWKRSFSQIAG